jgi:hypothetical protein
MATISPIETKTLILLHFNVTASSQLGATQFKFLLYDYNTKLMTTQHDCSHLSLRSRPPRLRKPCHLPGRQRCAIISLDQNPQQENFTHETL